MGSRRSADPHPNTFTKSTHLFWLGLAGGLPALAVALVFIWIPADQRWFGHTHEFQWIATVLLAGCWWIVAYAVKSRTSYALGSFANMMAAIRGGDYSVRARGADYDDAFGAIAAEINELSEAMRLHRVTTVETGALLDKVVEAIDIAVFAFDQDMRLRLVNPAGARLLAASRESLAGRTAAELNLDRMLEGAPSRLEEATFPGGPGRWDIRHAQFRQDGRPHRLLIVSDLSQALREEERLAWYRLIRVLGHEINNSLAPVMSLADSLAGLLEAPLDAEAGEDMARGLAVIRDRSAALNRFMGAYTRLAKLPPPDRRETNVAGLVQGVVRLEQRLPVGVRPGPDVSIGLDPDQVAQALINLLRNAVDAALPGGGGVQMGWEVNQQWLEIWIADEGPGLAKTSNLFVPFFTTKPGGSGIGLVFSRQIAEGHHGRLTLQNRRDRPGAEARLYLPLEV